MHSKLEKNHTGTSFWGSRKQNFTFWPHFTIQKTQHFPPIFDGT